MSERIAGIKEAVEELYACKATHLESVPVKETFRGETVWEGVVEVFAVTDLKTDRVYAWRYPDGKEYQYVTVVKVPPVDSPVTAVRAYLASLRKK